MPDIETNIAEPTITPEVKSETDLSFLNQIELKTMPEKPATIPATTTEQKAEESPEIDKNIENGTENATKDNNGTLTENSENQQQLENEDGEIYITPDDLGSYLAEETGGFINTVQELHTIIEANQELQNRITELEKNPIGVFKNPEQAAIAKFLMDYKGGDFRTGLQTYANLQQLDIPNMKAEDALRESYIMDRAQAGISRTDAEEMFKIEFDEKYSKYGEAAEKFINADAYDAKKKLEASKQAYTVEPSKDDDQAVQQEQVYKEARERYEKSVAETLTGFKSITIAGLTDNPAHDFTFDVENVKEIADGMDNYQQWFNGRYVSEGGVNAELMKQDLAWIQNREQISAMLFEHGKIIGKEDAIMERQNIAKKTPPPPSNLSGAGGIPQTIEQALLNAKLTKV